MDLIKIAEQAFAGEEKNFPAFKAGDTITVTYKIKEGDKERLQKFRGVCIQRKGAGATKTFTVRKMSGNVGVERIYPVNSPFIESIELNKVGKVRRAKIYYLRNLTGKKARIKEKSVSSAEPAATTAADYFRFDYIGLVAQLNRASDYGSEGCGFESHRGHQFRPTLGQINQNSR